MIALIAGVVIAAAPVPRCVSTGLRVLGVDPVKGAFFSEYLEQQLTVAGVTVTTRRDLESVLGLERQQELLGCDEGSSSCLAELSAAMRADGILFGTLAMLEGEYVFSAKVISSKGTGVLGLVTGRARGERELLELIEREARVLAAKLGVQVEAPGPRRYAWVPAVAGGVALAAGVGLFASSKVRESELRRGAPDLTSYAALQGAVSEVRNREAAALTAGAVGVAALLTAGAMYVFGGGTATVAIAPLPSGGAVVVQGRLAF